jgi:vancomycin resistance protein YoaR
MFPSGFDATVAWPNKDFRFRNTFPHPVYLRSQVSGSRLIVSVWGRVPRTAVAQSDASAQSGHKTQDDTGTQTVSTRNNSS